MYSYKLNRLAKNTIEIVVDVPKNTIEEKYKTAFSNLLQNLQVQGFRKGKVPAKIAEKHIKKEKIYEELIRIYFPQIYEDIIRKESLKPIISPKIELVNAKEMEDWQIKISVAEKPTITLGEYKDIVKKIKAEQKKSDIWTPGQQSLTDQTQQISEKEKARRQQELLNQILSAILKSVKCEISDLVIDEELNHRLSNLLTDIQKIGLNVDSYLKSKNLTQEQLKKQYKEEIEQTYKLEFILSELADKESIKVEQSDLDKLFASISDPKEKELAKSNSYFYASVLRKQKTIDYLLSI
ncbi:hypothetical protein A3C98_00035 [Candidatus Roizmanbacteria bacterium RIFCSPHIGHO2_02_FULL_37_15]|uniref:Uncharacterized protein n=1 Tax=Candidatus Roizmanbacteria bacterium RIFCSPLOWO2_01_FULL_37_16 TaxID=1802058 RepID=A0A1F7IKQ4_9BACT|nr:MAG: hypothetical protein A3C98_00035 [Candidatus Roizmanbacteria bacterium RIFCSPHIGHO2_02_FULL_37_15]OGK31781.1 MAG: hypothetical protein A3F57_00360 [Candidatus Roizmanbacteria bacterium RIFCSPHIGHO2_12_FULL_36_11]OGK43941.1 MAG: hypothetical protein A3B40_03995 [Candidatus Roizmanbacteria bacterium RIFCSPLOWO2_01_FULL_37_16]